MLLLKWVYFVVLIQAATQCACLAMLISTHGRRSDPKSCFHSFRLLFTEKNVKKEIFHDFIAFILEITNCKKSAKSICNPICRYGWQWYYKCTVGDLTLKCPFIHLLVSLCAYLPTCFKYFQFEFITATESPAPKNKCEPQHVWQCLRTEGYTTSKIFTTCLPTVGYTTSKSFHNNRQPSKLALTWWIICQK